MSTDRPAPTVTGKACGQWKQETDDVPGPIMVELHELAALQDFPDGYPFVGGKTSVARQIGNAFPASAAEAVIRALTVGYVVAMTPTPEPDQEQTTETETETTTHETTETRPAEGGDSE